jgi:hypothetical protein
MPNDISALRSTLFSVLEGLKDGTCKIDQAKAINETAQTLINTAKVEVDFMRAIGKTIDSEFLPALPAPDATPEALRKTLTTTGQQTTQPTPGGNVITHRLRG